MTTKDSLFISLYQLQRDLRGISPKLQLYKTIQAQIVAIEKQIEEMNK